MAFPRFCLLLLLSSVVQLQAVRDGRLDSKADKTSPLGDDDINKIFAQNSGPCGGVFLDRLTSPSGEKLVSHAWNKIDEPITVWLNTKESNITRTKAKLEIAANEIKELEKQTAFRTPPDAGIYQRMIEPICTEQFAKFSDEGAEGVEAALEVDCGLSIFCDDCPMYKVEWFADSFEKKYQADLLKYDFTGFMDGCLAVFGLKEVVPPSERHYETPWCDFMCQRMNDVVVQMSSDSGSGTEEEIRNKLNQARSRLQDLSKQLANEQTEFDQCKEAQTSLAEFTKTMGEFNVEHNKRTTRVQELQYQYLRAKRTVTKGVKELKEMQEKTDKILEDWDTSADDLQKLKEELERLKEKEAQFLLDIEDAENLIKASKDDLDAIQDAQNRVAEFKSALSLVLIKISLLYDSVVTSPLQRLIVDERYLRETFVDPTYVVTGINGAKLIDEITESLTTLSQTCSTTVVTSVTKIELVKGRLILPSEIKHVNRSANNEELQKLIDDMPMGIDEIDLPNDFLPFDRNPRVRNGLIDMCESPEVTAVTKTRKQILEVINNSRDHLITAFLDILRISNNELMLSVEEHHHHADDGHNHEDDDEVKYECDHEPKGIAKFASIFGNINFYVSFVIMWAHLDNGSGLSYFMRLEAMLEYLLKVAQSKSKDHEKMLGNLKEGLAEIVAQLEQLEKDLEEALKKHQDNTEQKEQIERALEDVKDKQEKRKNQMNELFDGLEAATKAVQANIQQAEDEHNQELKKHKRSSLLSIAMRKVHTMRKAKKSQIKPKVQKEAKKEEAGIYGNTAAAWRQEARELEIELQRLRKGAVYNPFMKH